MLASVQLLVGSAEQQCVEGLFAGHFQRNAKTGRVVFHFQLEQFQVLRGGEVAGDDVVLEPPPEDDHEHDREGDQEGGADGEEVHGLWAGERSEARTAGEDGGECAPQRR